MEFGSDDALARRLLGGDKAALEAIYYRHGGAMVCLARRMLSDEALAEDVVQDVFVLLWRHPERFEASRGSLRNYLLLQTRGRAMDAVRARMARHRREHRISRLHVSSHQDVESAAVLADQCRAVRGALAALRDAEREVIELAFFDGLTYRQVAASLELPEGTVKSRIRQGMQRVVAMLADVGWATP